MHTLAVLNLTFPPSPASALPQQTFQQTRNTKVVPGHGPLGNKADLTKFRDMLSTVREHLQKLKSSGKSLDEAVAAKPLADLDAAWGKGLFTSDQFVQIAYPAL